jgi:plasmid stabilization system protein ParE
MMQVYLSKLAESKLLKLTEYLLEEWNVKVRDEFINKLTEKINQISYLPKSCPQSNKFNGLFKYVISKQTTFYYRIHIKKQEIEIITFFDSKQDPSKLNKELI